jgi:beta-N-acetylhexosaminidase
VDETLARLSLRAKAAQVIGIRASGLGRDPDSREARLLFGLVEKTGVGTVCLFEGDVKRLPGQLNALQSRAPLPVLVAADLERGLAFRIREGVVQLPWTMAIGATRSEAAARLAGSIAAREARAVGIHWALGPVVDVNNNPDNPVINIRSFGEDPSLVSRLSVAWLDGARAGGLVTTAKHFPGHGDTSVDSHLRMAAVRGRKARLEAVELPPFRTAIAAGVDAVMVGHIAAPALDASGDPATFSRPMGRLLREDLAFGGLVVTDAMDMAGVRATWTAEATVRALEAEADVILLPPYPEVAIDAIVRAVRDGRISSSRLDASVRRLLTLKARLGLDVQRSVDETAVLRAVNRPEDQQAALEIARGSVTLVRNHGAVLPLGLVKEPRVLHLVLSSDSRNTGICGVPEAELARRGIAAVTETLGPRTSTTEVDRIVALAEGKTHVLASCFVRVTGSKGTADMVSPHARLLRRLAAGRIPVIVVSYGSPYLLRQFPEVGVYVAAYGAAEPSQRAAMELIFGAIEPRGRLPVTLPGLHPAGHGLSLFETSPRTGGKGAP